MRNWVMYHINLEIKIFKTSDDKLELMVPKWDIVDSNK